jgi:hypothetical protein
MLRNKFIRAFLIAFKSGLRLNAVLTGKIVDQLLSGYKINFTELNTEVAGICIAYIQQMEEEVFRDGLIWGYYKPEDSSMKDCN